jgi:hypothetical protein
MSQQQESKGTRVRVEIRGRMTDRRIFDLVCKSGDADFGAKKGEFARILLEAIQEGKRAVVTGNCKDGKPMRLTNLAQELRIPMVFVVGHEEGRNYGQTYCTNQKWGLSPTLPMTAGGPAVTGDLINRMLKENPFYGLEVISKSLAWYDPENYPNFTMPRSLQVELMPDEKIGIFAGIRR